jgi:hypothetical protein
MPILTRSESKKRKLNTFIYLSNKELSKLSEDELDEYYRLLPVKYIDYPLMIIKEIKNKYNTLTKEELDYSSEIWKKRHIFYN